MLGEILRSAVDHPFGPKAAYKLEMRGIADSGHVHPAARQQLDGRRADGPGRAVDEDTLSGANLRRLDVREGVVGAFGGRGGLSVGEVPGKALA